MFYHHYIIIKSHDIIIGYHPIIGFMSNQKSLQSFFPALLVMARWLGDRFKVLSNKSTGHVQTMTH